MGVRLPAEYQEVEYLEASGYQYFTSNIWLQDGITVDAVQTNGGGDCYLFGSRGSPTSNRACFNGHYGGAVEAVYNAYYTYAPNFSVNNDVFHHIILTQKDKIAVSYFDGVEVLNAIKGSSNIVEDQNSLFGVFGQRDTNGSFGFLYCGKVSSIKVLKDDNLLANYVPCYRKSDDKPGMYDLVLGKYYASESRTDFIAGPDVIDSISPWLVARRRMLMKLPKAGGTSDYFVENIVAQRSAITGLGFYPLAEDVAFTLLVDFQIVSPTTPNTSGIDIVSCGFTAGNFNNAIRICYYGNYFICRVSNSGSDFWTNDQNIINARHRCALRYDPSITNKEYVRWNGRAATQVNRSITISQQEAKTGGHNGGVATADNYANINGIYFYKKALSVEQMESFLNNAIIP